MSEINKKMKTFSPMSKYEKDKQKRMVVEYINDKFNKIGGINKYSNGTNGDYFMRNVKNGINFYCKNIYLSKELRKLKSFGMFNFNKIEFADEGLEIKDEINEIVENVDDFIEGETIVYTPPSQLPPPPSEWLEDEEKIVEIPEEKQDEWYLTPKTKNLMFNHSVMAIYKERLQDKKLIEKYMLSECVGEIYLQDEALDYISELYDIPHTYRKEVDKSYNKKLPYIQVKFTKDHKKVRIGYLKQFKTHWDKIDKLDNTPFVIVDWKVKMFPLLKNIHLK